MARFEYPKRCALCGEPGRKVRHNVYEHAVTAGEGVGPKAHGFVPDDVAYDERIDRQVKDRQFFARTHRDEIRASLEHAREMGEIR